jgi:hypothetical protein
MQKKIHIILLSDALTRFLRSDIMKAKKTNKRQIVLIHRLLKNSYNCTAVGSILMMKY